MSPEEIKCPFCKTNLKKQLVIYSCLCTKSTMDFSHTRLSIDEIFGDRVIKYQLSYNFNSQSTYLKEYKDHFYENELIKIASKYGSVKLINPITKKPYEHKPYYLQTDKIFKKSFELPNKSLDEINSFIEKFLRMKNIQ